MSTTPRNASDLVDRLMTDEAFAEALAGLHSQEAIQDFLHAEGYEFSWEDFGKALEARVKTSDTAALSDEALALISGGNVGDFLKHVFVDFPSELGKGVGQGMVNIVKKVAGDIHDAANSGLNAAKNSSSLQNYGSNMSRARNPFAG